MPKTKNKIKNNVKNQRFTVERISEKATRWIGSPTSIILHTTFFIGIFVLALFGVAFDKIMLVLTTVVSLEAIYLSIFIQMTVNRNTTQLGEVVEDIEEIQEDVEGIEKDVDEIQKDVDGLEEEFDEISDEIEKDDEEEKKRDKELLEKIEISLKNLMEEISELKKQEKK